MIRCQKKQTINNGGWESTKIIEEFQEVGKSWECFEINVFHLPSCLRTVYICTGNIEHDILMMLII